MATAAFDIWQSDALSEDIMLNSIGILSSWCREVLTLRHVHAQGRSVSDMVRIDSENQVAPMHVTASPRCVRVVCLAQAGVSAIRRHLVSSSRFVRACVAAFRIIVTIC